MKDVSKSVPLRSSVYSELRRDIRNCKTHSSPTVSNAGAGGIEPSYSVLETEDLPLIDAPYSITHDIIYPPQFKLLRV